MPVTLPIRDRRRRDPATVRIATFSARHRWPVVALWFVATVGVFLASIAAGGTNTQGAISRDQRARFESAEAYDVFAAAGPASSAPAVQTVIVVVGDDRGIADAAAQGALDDVVATLRSLRSTVAAADGPTFTDVVDPRQAPPAADLVSADRTAARVIAHAEGDGDVLDERLAPLPDALDRLRTAHQDVELDGVSNWLANHEISHVVNNDLDGSLRLTIPITFAILLVAFGAVVAAFVPLVLAVTALLAAFGVLGLYSQAVDPVSPYASQLVVLIGLAVAVDYSLFLVSRFRSELRRGRDVRDAIRAASATAGRAVFFSGLAVMISIAGLLLLDDPLFKSMAIATIAVVFVSVVGSFTFLPATLAILGGGVNRLRIPFFGRSREEGTGIWAAIVRAAMRRPLAVGILAAAALLAVGTPVARLHLGSSDLSSFPDSVGSVRAFRLISQKWPQGTELSLQVVVTRANEPATQAAIGRLEDRLTAIPGLSGPATVAPSTDGTAAMVTATMAGGQNDESNREIVQTVRSQVVPELFGPLPGVRALVTGDAAFVLDQVLFYERGMIQVFAFVLGLSFLLLLLAFRSIVIPIKAIVLNLLSTAASYGVLVLVFQEGWFGSILGVRTGGVIESFVPVFVFTILFGLSMDYHVFILTRIKEARDRGAASNEAVERGISITSGTVTSAAAIMVAVFAVFVTLQLVIIKQLGLGLAVAVLVDATVIRSVLLPATMRLLGDWNWWLPRWLGWLPRVTIEVEDEPSEGPAAAPASVGPGQAAESPTGG
ncbi:MAG TPA: MMPL family transporter [Candidatus Limnocylindrales bacterium]|nr:MMPL family transporter [Candidatus Limnocylindrales bacterium]